MVWLRDLPENETYSTKNESKLSNSSITENEQVKLVVTVEIPIVLQNAPMEKQMEPLLDMETITTTRELFFTSFYPGLRK